MFIKLTLLRELDGKQVELKRIHDIRDIKCFSVETMKDDKGIIREGMYVYYKTYGDADGNEFDEIKETAAIISTRLQNMGLFNPDPKVEIPKQAEPNGSTNPILKPN